MRFQQQRNLPFQESSNGGGPSKDSNQLSPGKKIFTIVTIVVAIVITAVVLQQNGSALSSLKETSNYLKEMMANWELGIITDIKVQQTCDSGYEAISWKWPGTITGCKCSSNFTAGACSSSQTSCTTVEKTDAKNLTTVFAGNSLCIKRDNTINFVNSAKKSPWKCEEGKRPCGVATNFEKRLCIPNSISCPINKIWTEVKDNDCQSAPNCAVIAQSGLTRTLLKWANDDESYAYVEFEFEEHDLCLLKNDENISPNRKDYLLRNPKRSPCKAPVVDDPNFGFKKLVSINEKEILDKGGILTEVQKLPEFTSTTDLEKYNWGLYTRTYMPWKNESRCRFEVEEFHKRSDEFFKLSSLMIGTLTVSIIAGLVTGLALPGMEIANLMGKDLPCFKGDGEEERKRLRKFKAITGLVFKFIQVPMFIIGTVIAYKQSGFFIKISDMNCTTGQAENDIDEATQAIKKAKVSNIVSLSLILVMFLFEIYKTYKDKKDENERVRNLSRVEDIPQNPNGSSMGQLDNSMMMDHSQTALNGGGAFSEMGHSTTTGTTAAPDGGPIKKKKRKIPRAKSRLDKQMGVEGANNANETPGTIGMNSMYQNQQQQLPPNSNIQYPQIVDTTSQMNITINTNPNGLN